MRRNKAIPFVLAASVFYFIIVAFPEPLFFELPPGEYVVIHSILEAVSIIIAFLIFAVIFQSHTQARDHRSLFLGVAFLSIGMIDVFHGLSYKGMPDFVTPNSVGKAAEFWVAARFIAATAFVLSFFVSPDSDRPFLRPAPLVLFALLVTGGVFAAVIVYPGTIPAMFVPGEGLTTAKVAAEYIITGLLVTAAVLYAFRYHRTKQEDIPFLIGAMVLATLSELLFTLYASAYDMFNLAGHVYKVFAYFLIYQLIFANSIRRPYRELSASREELAQYAATLEEKVRIRTRALASKNEELVKLNRLKTDFLAMCSHDMKTPLQSSMLVIEMLLGGYEGELTPEQAESLTALEKNQEELHALITNLLDLARLESGEMTISPSEADVGMMVGSWAVHHEKIAKRMRLDFSVKIPGDGRPLVIELDAFKVTQVLNNLMSNALKFTPPGGDIRLSVSPEEEGGGAVRFSMFNSGPAIPEEEIRTIFAKYGRSKSSGRKRKEGTGLGLTIARNIVELHGGRIWAESSEGSGNTFSFTLPERPPAHVSPSKGSSDRGTSVRGSRAV